MKVHDAAIGFHDYRNMVELMRSYTTYRPDVKFTYTFENFFHPFVTELVEQLNTKSLPGLLDATFHAGLAEEFFSASYTPHPVDNLLAFSEFPEKTIDVSDGGPYSGYNWELLFHVPLTIAVHLSKNQRFAEAQRWFHYIFDPTSTDASIPAPKRYWKFLRFRQETDVQQVDELLMLLSKPASECTQPEKELKVKILEGYQAIKDHPFQPHRVARTRIIAYQYAVIMKYLDNRIAWGDHLFTQDTVESITEATQHYVLAANLLGPRPQRIPSRGTVQPKSFHQLRATGLDPMGNALVELEAKFPFNLALPSAGGSAAGSTGDQSGPLMGIGRTLYFCIPRNEKLLGYWDTVGDRLMKIRNCMNIQGVVRQLALFDPPLDPGMLVKAVAAGIDVGGIIGGLNQPLAPVRAQFLIQKALELCGEVRGLGTALLSAIEKQDSERLALLRQEHEIAIHTLSREVRFLQWKQAQDATESLLRTRRSTVERYDFALRKLGLSRDTNVVPDTFVLGERTPLTEATFDQVFGTLVGQYDKVIPTLDHPLLALAGESAPETQSGAAGTGPLYLTPNENVDLNRHAPMARDIRETTMTADIVSAILALIPDVGVELAFWGLGGRATVFGGSLLAGSGRFYSGIKNLDATNEETQGSNAAKTATFERRADDWIQESNLAALELMQNGRQLIGSLIAEQVTHREYLNIQKQIDQSTALDRELHQKFSNEQLYEWMHGELSRLYYEYYRFAFDTARKAERLMKHELMRPEVESTEYVRFNYWDGGRKGLLSGDALYLDLKRMEIAYHENNRREFEMTRHVSLRQLDPVALLSLKVTGHCEFSIPESLFDRDCPGHYLRRLRSVAVSIPSVVGPYTSLNGTLSLLRSSVRTSAVPGDDGYARVPAADPRFVDYVGTAEQMVTSGGTNDSGMFEANLRDDRPLPFERAGAISSWRLDLTKRFRAFDYLSISDVVVHLRYTARQGGELLGDAALEALEARLQSATEAGLALLFSLRHDFPTEWSLFANGDEDLTLTLRKNLFPYLVQDEHEDVDIALDSVELFARKADALAKRTVLSAADQGELDDLADAINDGTAGATLSVAADANVLRRDAAAQPFLIIRYHLDA